MNIDNYTIDRVTERLRKAAARTPDPVIRDQIRIACNTLNAYREKPAKDELPYEVIDLFDPALPAFPKHAILIHDENV